MTKKLLQYLKGMQELGIELRNYKVLLELTGFADAEYTISLYDRNSTSGDAIYFQGKLIFLNSKKKTVVAQSTTKANFISINVCEKQIWWLKNLLIDLNIWVGIPKIKNDNSSAVIISKELCLSNDSKHIVIFYQYLQDIVSWNQLSIEIF